MTSQKINLSNNQNFNIVAWSAPSNIAFIKYWGKSGVQIPMNASISMSLSNCNTETFVEWVFDKNLKNTQFDFYLNKEKNKSFDIKIDQYFSRLSNVLPLIKNLKLKIYSKNNFPHSAGIASSASGFAALAICIAEIEQRLRFEIKKLDYNEQFFCRASEFARLGSGSACRSLFKGFSLWGDVETIETSSNQFAIEYTKIDPVFKELCDWVLIVNDKPKEVSSSLGHKLMNEHFYKDRRIDEAKNNLTQLLKTLSSGDIEKFGNIIESEAMSLHSLMMTSKPSYILLEAQSLILIKLIKRFRVETKLPLFFTLDAGPNIHLIFPKKILKDVEKLFEQRLKSYCLNLIKNDYGNGPINLALNKKEMAY